LLVVKLDRLTRPLLDLDMLIRGYFTKEQYHLLSVSESLDTRTAMGRFVLYILGLIAQWERESISERTRDAMAHLKQQGVAMGGAPYGFAYSAVRDEAGRKRLVEVPEQMSVIARILELFDVGTSASLIAALLNEEGTAAPHGDVWYMNIVRRILERNQRPGRRYKPRIKRAPRVWDRQRATELALACRKDGLSLRAIAKELDAANLAPPRGGEWYAAQVAELLGAMSTPNEVDERTRAQQLRAEGRTLREIGHVLLAEGYRPTRAAQWHTQAVSALLAAS
jgi:DNA invertase Pin-like site-specific DNA recombinase